VLTALLAVCVQIGKLRAEAPSGGGCPAAATGSPASSPDLTDISGRRLSIEYNQGGLAAPSHGERDAGKSTVADLDLGEGGFCGPPEPLGAGRRLTCRHRAAHGAGVRRAVLHSHGRGGV
jgi:hypothetical protein